MIFFSQTAIGLLVISNHNSFRVPFDKNCFRVFYPKKIYINILALETTSPSRNRHCASCIGTVLFPTHNGRQMRSNASSRSLKTLTKNCSEQQQSRQLNRQKCGYAYERRNNVVFDRFANCSRTGGNPLLYSTRLSV